ncbi:hypothetical protein AALP_AA7G205900 [Arabis alpina]|uniref:Uncharacterized protein n=1 Tax=Arabis alpina TaxID=50452 RepID=A0A087GJF7_ARAAL|nr:hypothetical protein AALP_AA7G205900 [Arabis alpina]
MPRSRKFDGMVEIEVEEIQRDGKISLSGGFGGSRGRVESLVSTTWPPVATDLAIVRESNTTNLVIFVAKVTLREGIASPATSSG